MTQALGADVQLMIVEEAAYGAVPGSPAGFVLPVSNIAGNWFSRNLIEFGRGFQGHFDEVYLTRFRVHDFD